MANDAIPFWEDADRFTGIATVAVVGKTCADISAPMDHVTQGASPGPQVATCAAGVRPCGVFAWDAQPGSVVTVIVAGTIPITAGAAINAGQEVEVDASGHVIPHAAGTPAGKCWDTVAQGADAPIFLYL
jgi:hypothetical protein